MNKTYDKEFDVEIERILYQIYYNTRTPNSGDKRAVVQTEYKFIMYLVEKGLVKILNIHGGGKYGLILHFDGYEVFEKYENWNEYKKKVIDKKSKAENAKILAQRYWWIPIAISIIALLIAIFK